MYNASPNAGSIIYWSDGISCCDEKWEQAYRRFETPRQEVDKFKRRLIASGAKSWDKNSRIVEIFCGRGNGIRALQSLGFRNVEGVDLSPALLKEAPNDVQRYCGDCRAMQFADDSRDILIVQGGLHHLPSLPSDLAMTLNEVNRVLVSGGRLVVVEPWLTPFLSILHSLESQRLLRAMWPKFDAFSVMHEQERTTYDRWLSIPSQILPLIKSVFQTERLQIAWGKLNYVGRKQLKPS